MPVTAAQRLKRALCDITEGGKAERVVAFARSWGLSGALARRAARGLDVNANDFLKFCAAIGIDPIDDRPVEPRRIADLDWRLVGVKVLATLIGSPGDKNLTMRAAAKQWKVSLVALARMKSGQIVGIENLLRLCRALKCHPHEFLTRQPGVFHGEQQVEHIENTEAVA